MGLEFHKSETIVSCFKLSGKEILSQMMINLVDS